MQSFLRPAAVLCANPIWRRDWRKTSFLRRSPMPRGQAWQSKQGNPFQPVYRRILANAPFKPDGVRAIPADHDVYPWGDEPSGAMIQTEPSEPKLSKILQDPSSLHNVNRTGRHSGAEAPRGCKPFLLPWMTAAIARLFRPRKWWSLSGSNRRPPACKAGALPAELRPQSFVPSNPSTGKLPGEWWARVDSNYRPHPYQGCALTN